MCGLFERKSQFIIMLLLGLTIGFSACKKKTEVIIQTETITVTDTLTIVDTITVSDTATTFILIRHAETTGGGKTLI